MARCHRGWKKGQNFGKKVKKEGFAQVESIIFENFKKYLKKKVKMVKNY
jgi:hypothetical protein